jgi:ADP-ribose pyrophosphatase YjhB (NUDIX family)
MFQRLLLKLWGLLPLPEWIQWKLLSLWTPKFRVAVAAIVLNERRQILLCEHTYRGKYPWGLPGGSLKAHEDPEQAVKREIDEETGLCVQVVRPLILKSLQHFSQINITYLCYPTGGSYRANAEVASIRFFPLDDLPESLLPSERELIHRAIQKIDDGELHTEM